MSLRNILKPLIKKPLNALGLDVIRLNASDASAPPAMASHFGPFEGDKILWLSSRDIHTVIDVGAHVGEFAGTIHRILPAAAILSFEPLEESFRQLKANMKDVPNFRAFNYACGSNNAHVDMYRNEFTPSSSLLHMAQLHKSSFTFTERETVEVVEVRRLDDVALKLDLKDDILIKIDVQGYEREVIKGGEDLVSRAKMLIVETSFRTLYEGQPLFDEIYSLLRRMGFKYVGSWNQLLSPVDGSVLQADAIFDK
jgi:FkbM family methyltransferase